MLEIIRDSLKEVTVVGCSTDQDKTSAERLFSVLGDNMLSAAGLMEQLGLSHRPTFRKNYLNPALEQNLIERTIPDKPNSKNQKYRKCIFISFGAKFRVVNVPSIKQLFKSFESVEMLCSAVSSETLSLGAGVLMMVDHLASGSYVTVIYSKSL